MYSAILKGKAAAWFRSATKRSWFAGVLILALCVPAISACSAGGNGEGEAGGTATGKGSSAPAEFEYGNEVEHWNVALSDRSRDSFDEAAYNAALQEFRAAIEGDDASALLGAYDELERLFADLSSDRALANFDQACAGFDEAAASAYAAKQAAYDSHYQECAHAFMDALESKHGEAFRAHILARGSRASWAIRARRLRKALRCERSVTIWRVNIARSWRKMRATPSSSVSTWSSSMQIMPGREAWDTRTTSSTCSLRNMGAITRWPKLKRRKMR